MHILCFIASLIGGGAERQMIELIKGLSEKGYNVSILTYSKNRISYIDLPENVNHIYIPFRGNKIMLSLRLIHAIHKAKPDCLISFLTQNNQVAVASTLPFKRYKLIVSERNLTQRVSLHLKLVYQLFRRADYIVPNSVSEAKFICEHAEFLSNKVKTIINYTDIKLFHPISRLDIKKSKFIEVGIFARYTSQKNPLFLAKVAKQLKDDGLNIRFNWFGNNKLVGSALDISEEYINLQALIQELDISDIFQTNGFSINIVDDINNMDIICLASHYEGFPNAISEGMACGKPIIASAVSDIPSMIEDGIEGFLFESNNVVSAVNAFKFFYMLSTEQRNEMGIASRRRAENLFNREHFLNQYIELFKNNI